MTSSSKTVHNLFNSWYIDKLFPVNYTEYAAEYNCLMKYQNRREVTNDLWRAASCGKRKCRSMTTWGTGNVTPCTFPHDRTSFYLCLWVLLPGVVFFITSKYYLYNSIKKGGDRYAIYPDKAHPTAYTYPGKHHPRLWKPLTANR